MAGPNAVPARAVAESRYAVWTAVLLGAILAAKLAVLAWLGPTAFDDTRAYLALGDAVLQGGRWLHDGGWGTGPSPMALLRPYGYPLLVALAKLVFGAHFALALASLQCILSVATLGLVARMLGVVIAAPGIRYAVLVLIALSGSSLFDVALLSDSLYASIFVTVTFLIALEMAGPARLTGAWWLALGLLWGYSIWVRDVGIYFTLFPLLGLLVAARQRGWNARALLKTLFLFLTPIVIMTGLYMAWNGHRTGHVFLSITGAINWLWPSFNIVALGLADPFDTNDLIASITHSHAIAPGLAGMYQVMDILWRDYGLDPLQIQQVTVAHFKAVLAHHPVAYLASVLRNVQFERLADLLFNPLANFNDFVQLGPVVRHRVVPGMREVGRMLLHHPGAAEISLGLAVAATTVLALIGLTISLAATPILSFRQVRRGNGAAAVAVAYLWFTFVGVVGAYALVHLEMRLALPVVPAALTCFGYCVDRMRPAPAQQGEPAREAQG